MNDLRTPLDARGLVYSRNGAAELGDFIVVDSLVSWLRIDIENALNATRLRRTREQQVDDSLTCILLVV